MERLRGRSWRMTTKFPPVDLRRIHSRSGRSVPKEARKEADRLACEAWDQAHAGASVAPAQPADIGVTR